jgi:hypothetical protein
MPCPPNLGLSRQLRQRPQSSRPQASQLPQATVRFRFFCRHCCAGLGGAGLFAPEFGPVGEGRPRLSPRAVISTAKGVRSAVIGPTAARRKPSDCENRLCFYNDLPSPGVDACQVWADVACMSMHIVTRWVELGKEFAQTDNAQFFELK